MNVINDIRDELENDDSIVASVAGIVRSFEGLRLPMQDVSKAVWAAVVLGFAHGQKTASDQFLAALRKKEGK